MSPNTSQVVALLICAERDLFAKEARKISLGDLGVSPADCDPSKPLHGLEQGVLVRLIVFNLPTRSLLWLGVCPPGLISSMTLALSRDLKGPDLSSLCAGVYNSSGLEGGIAAGHSFTDSSAPVSPQWFKA